MRKSVIFLMAAGAACGQTVVNGSRTVKGSLRVQGTTATIQSGASLPVQCNAGPPADVFIRSADNTYHFCSAANTWTMIAGGAGGTTGTTIPTGNAIPKAGADGKLAIGWMPVMTGDAGTGGMAGLAPAPAAGDRLGKFLRGDGMWAAPSGSGGTGLPDQSGNSGKLLATNGSAADWRGVGSGLLVDAIGLKVDTAVSPMLGGLNRFTGTNTFDGTVNGSGVLDASGMTLRSSGYTLMQRSAPGAPVIGEVAVWADQTTGKLSCKDASGGSCMPGGQFKIPVEVARCEGGTARLLLSTAASGGPSAACVASGSALSAVVQFTGQPASPQYVHGHTPLPDDWTGAIDLKLKWRAGATTNSVVWAIETACVGADGNIASPTFNAASTVTQAASLTANGLSTATINGIGTNGCAAGHELYWRLYRTTNDTLAGVAELVGIEFTMRRAW